MALTVNKEGGFGDFKNNIPNKNIMDKLYSIIMAGCAVTKDYVVGLTNKGGLYQEDTLVDEAGNETEQ